MDINKYEALVSQINWRMGADKEKEEVIKSFSPKTMEDIIRIKENEKTMTKQEYFDIYNNHQNNFIYMHLLLQLQSCPSEIIDMIIKNENMVWNVKQIRDLFNRKDVTDEQIKWACKNRAMKIETAIGTTNGYRGKYNIVKNLGDDATIRVIEQLKALNMNGMASRLMKFVNDEEYVKRIINEDNMDIMCKETSMSEIISNYNISDEVRNMAFDAGADIEFIHSYTPYIANEIYERATETIFEINDENFKKTDDYSKALEIAHTALYFMGVREVLTDAQQYDYINRLKLLNPRAQDRTLSTFLPQVTYVPALLLAKELKNKDALVAYENPNMPKEEIVNKAHTYCSRMHKNGVLKTFPDIWIDYLSTFVKRATLKEADYLPLIKYIGIPQRPSSGTELALNIAISPYTPEDVLNQVVKEVEEIKKKPVRDSIVKKIDAIIDASKINLEYRKRALNQDACSSLLTLIHTAGNILSTAKNISPYERNILERFENETGTPFSIYAPLLTDIKETLQSKTYKSNIERLLYINQTIQNEINSYDNNSIETMSHYAICCEQDNMRKEISDAEGAIALYEKIYQFADRYSALCERKTYLEKQEKECEKLEEKAL